MKRHPQTIDDKIRKIIKKTNLLKKKFDTFGLDQNEIDHYRDLSTQFFTLHDELVDKKFDEWLMIDLYNKEALGLMIDIQKYIPWTGGKITRDSELEDILIAASSLDDRQRKEIEESLNRLHELVFKSLEKSCQNDDYYEFVETIGGFVVNKEHGDIRDVVNYIDERYRDFAEMVEVELNDLEIDWV